MKTLLAIPVVSFLIRYWKLLLACGLLVWFTRNDSAFASFGALIYGPGQVFLALSCAILARHLFFTQSADADAADGTFTKFWKEDLTATTRVVLNVLMVCAFYLGACWIFAAMGK